MCTDILIKNGKCMTMKNGDILDWIAIEGGKIAAIGKNSEYDKLITEDTLVIDANGNTILPGFIDSHFHIVLTALNSASIDLSKAKKFEDIGRLIKEEVVRCPGKHIRGIHLEVEQLKEKKFPNRAILDKYCNNVAVSLHSADYQVSMLNTYAMLYFKIPFTTDGIEMDNKQMPTGVFRKQANAILYLNTLKDVNDNYRKNVVDNIINKLLSNGITTINAMEGGRMCGGMEIDKDAEFIFNYGKQFPIDMEIFYPTMDIDKIKDMGLKRIGGVLYLDGTIGGRTAALNFEYADAPETNGILCMAQDDINEFVLNCYNNNLQVALFALGDRSIESALVAHEYALEKTGITGLRHRLEHVELVSCEQMKRASKMGIIFSMQPTYEAYWGGKGKMYEQRLGNNYVRTNCFREIIDNGVTICGGSDSDVTEPNPLLGIHSAVNHPVKQHRVNVYEALKMYTCNGAYALFEENKKGTLEVGKIADIIILNNDIMAVSIEEIQQLKVLVTIKSGELLYNVL